MFVISFQSFYWLYICLRVSLSNIKVWLENDVLYAKEIVIEKMLKHNEFFNLFEFPTQFLQSHPDILCSLNFDVSSDSYDMWLSIR
jgi:hypothetical protein